MRYFKHFRPGFANRLALRGFGLYLACTVMPVAARADLHHALEVTLNPVEHTLAVVDSITRDDASGPLEFELHPQLVPELLTAGVTMEPVDVKTSSHPSLSLLSGHLPASCSATLAGVVETGRRFLYAPAAHSNLPWATSMSNQRSSI